LKTELKSEWKEKDTEEQFIYKTRKKGFGPFKYEMWHLSSETMDKIGSELERQFAFLFEKLKMKSTYALLEKYIKPVDVPFNVPLAWK